MDQEAKGFYVLGNLGSRVEGKGIIPFDQTRFYGVLRPDQVLYRGNLESESRPSELDLFLIRHGISSDLLLPLVNDGEMIGAIHFSSRRIAGFNHEDIRIGQIVAGQLSAALQRATEQRSTDRRRVNG